MPQDGSKSVVYRSFFSCDDPKGVADCKTSRKSKAFLQKPENKVDHQRKQKNLDLSLSGNEDGKDMVSKGATGDLHNQSSVQLREVSRGAHKLNQVIDNLSKGLTFGSQPKDIAKDLLRGALDLQESLEMLGKLQEASQYMVKLKKNHKEKANNGGKLDGSGVERTTSDRFGIERTTSDRFGIERTTSDRFGYLNKMAFQKPRLSVDGSSRDCYNELREVIRESFARQNILPKSSVEEKDHFDKRKSYSEGGARFGRTNSCSKEKAYFESTHLDLPVDFPSSSSSQSSMFHSHEFESFDSSLSRSQEEKPKGSNVIAKLMGLEEFPAKTWQSTLQKEKKDKQLNHYRPTLDTDLPVAREPHRNFQKVIDSRRSTSEELIETLHFQGHVSDNGAHGSKHHKHLSNVSDWRTGLAEDSPPIVIMKPFLPSVSFQEEFQNQKHMPKELTRKWKMEKAVPAKKVIDSKGALPFSEIQRKLQAEMSPLKRLSKYKGEKNVCNVLQDSDDSLIIVKEIKASSPVKPKMQKKEVMDKKVDKIKRMAPNTRELKEVDTSKSKDAAKPHNVNKPTSTIYQKKTEREHNLSKSRVAQQKGTPSKSALEHSQLTASHSPNTRKKNAKYEKGLSTLPSTAKNDMKCRNEDIQNEPSCEDKHEVTIIKIAPPEELPIEAESTPISVNDKCSQNFHCNSTEPIIHDKIDIQSFGDANNCFSNISTENQICKMGDATRNLLFANSSFLNQAKELFNFKENQPIVPLTTNLCDAGVADNKLLFDCAEERLEHKSLQYAQGAGPLAHCIVKRSKPVVSLEHLVGEICEGIADLRSYHKLSSGERIAVDFLQLVLQKDIWGKGVASGAWDSGWRCGFSLGEIEEVIIEIEHTVFSGIIEDLLTDFLG